MPEVRNMGSTTIVRSEPLVSAREEAVRPRREEVREQLGRLLANPLFQHSKHYPGFLRYVVNETLEGRGGYLKERALGVEVFGRDQPDLAAASAQGFLDRFGPRD